MSTASESTALTPARYHRILHLVLALADDTRWGRTDEWIAANVPGYTHVKEDSARKYIGDDIALLRRNGVDVTTHARRGTHKIEAGAWQLDGLGLTEDEAAVVRMSTEVRFGDESLTDLAADGWAKIAAVARRRDLRAGGGTIIIADRGTLDQEQLTVLADAMEPPRSRVHFYYAPMAFADEHLRTIEPWTLVNLRGRMYVLGHDVDRDAVRVFRMARMTDIAATSAAATVPLPEGDLQAIAERALNRGAELRPAIVRIAPSTCGDLTVDARQLGDDRWELAPRTSAELVDAGLEHAGNLEIIEPADIRERVIAVLTEIVRAGGVDGGGAGGVGDGRVGDDDGAGGAGGEEQR